MDVSGIRDRRDQTGIRRQAGVHRRVRPIAGGILGESASETDSGAARDDAADWLTSYLKACGGEATWADVRKAARAEGIAERTLHRARTRAGVVTERSGFPARAVWRITTGDARSPAATVVRQSRQSRQDPERGTTGEPLTQQANGHHTASPAVPFTLIRTDAAGGAAV